jgi:Kef-type K+ transport system membrane component KefB
MSRVECRQCGTPLPQAAAFCRQCGGKVGSFRSAVRDVLVGVAWFAGVCVWIILGTLTAFAGAEGWQGVAAGTGFLFAILFLGGIAAACMMK